MQVVLVIATMIAGQKRERRYLLLLVATTEWNLTKVVNNPSTITAQSNFNTSTVKIGYFLNLFLFAKFSKFALVLRLIRLAWADSEAPEGYQNCSPVLTSK